jgi:hypothetical protein
MEPSSSSPEHEERRLARQQRNRKRARLLDASVCAIGLIALLVLVVPGLRGPVLYSWPGDFAVLVTACAYFSSRTWRRRLRARTAPEMLASDHRPPILYLRPFTADRWAWLYNQEGQIARILRKLGPLVAVGRPNEKLPPTSAIAREYVADRQWQDRVVDLIGRAQLIIIRTAVSQGLTWELTQVVRLVRPDQLLIWPDRGAGVPRWQLVGKQANLRYRQFRAQFGWLFPKGLPAEIRYSVFIAFGSDWTPIPSRQVKDKLLHNLHEQLWMFSLFPPLFRVSPEWNQRASRRSAM